MTCGEPGRPPAQGQVLCGQGARRDGRRAGAHAVHTRAGSPAPDGQELSASKTRLQVCRNDHPSPLHPLGPSGLRDVASAQWPVPPRAVLTWPGPFQALHAPRAVRSYGRLGPGRHSTFDTALTPRHVSTCHRRRRGGRAEEPGDPARGQGPRGRPRPACEHLLGCQLYLEDTTRLTNGTASPGVAVGPGSSGRPGRRVAGVARTPVPTARRCRPGAPALAGGSSHPRLRRLADPSAFSPLPSRGDRGPSSPCPTPVLRAVALHATTRHQTHVYSSLTLTYTQFSQENPSTPRYWCLTFRFCYRDRMHGAGGESGCVFDCLAHESRYGLAPPRHQRAATAPGTGSADGYTEGRRPLGSPRPARRGVSWEPAGVRGGGRGATPDEGEAGRDRCTGPDPTTPDPGHPGARPVACPSC